MKKIKKIMKVIASPFVNYFKIFQDGDIKTRLSYLIMGFGNFTRKQVAKGLLFLGIEIGFIAYMIVNGFYYLSMLSTLGVNEQTEVWNEEKQIYQKILGDNSLLLLLFGICTVVIIIAFICVYYMNIKSAYHTQKLAEQGKHINSFKEDYRDLWDKNFHITVLSVPLLLTFVFTVLPLIFMIALAFTNYNKTHQPPGKLFTWVGLSNFKDLFGGNPFYFTTFRDLFIWTIVWAIFATFLNYILGMLLAILINRKGIKFKGMWRTFFVITIAVPQFVSLMLMSKLLHDQGAVNVLLRTLGILGETDFIPFLTNGTIAKVVVIVVNLWVGVPYSMLITSGILMNIPQDLYESAKIDGAGPWKMFTKITLPYMLFVTTPYLITQFIGNINNFNVIYLLTAGDPKSLNYYQAGETDLLVTWLYKLSSLEQNYALASVIGIIVFVICASLSLLTYNKSGSTTREEEFQ